MIRFTRANPTPVRSLLKFNLSNRPKIRSWNFGSMPIPLSRTKKVAYPSGLTADIPISTVGCAWSPKIVFHEFFSLNPDSEVPEYQTRLGVYQENGGLDSVDMSWGHDEYLYHVTKDYLPEEALYMIRYHSFYPAHREGAYDYLMNDHDREMFHWVREFNPYDLYSKAETRPEVGKLRPYYEVLISRYFPSQIQW